MYCPTSCFPSGLGSLTKFLCLCGGVKDILKFRDGVSLEGSSSLKSRAESLSEDSFGIIGCSGLKVYFQDVGKVAAAHGCGFLSVSVEILRIRVFEHLELPTKLPDYFLRSNKRNIN